MGVHKQMIILSFFVASIVLWIFFIALANTVNAHRRRNYTGVKYYVVWLLAAVFLVCDIIYDKIYGSLAFWQLPVWEWNELTLTARLKRNLLYLPMYSWRWKLSFFVCSKMVEPWDWNHCGLVTLAKRILSGVKD